MFDEATDKLYNDFDFYKNKTSMDKLSHVKTRLQYAVLPLLAKLEGMGWQPIVAQGLRTVASEQDAIDKGNSSLKDPTHSKHVIGEAVDVVDARYGWDGAASHLGFQFWKDWGTLIDDMKEDTLTWGGDWGKGFSRYEDALPTPGYFCDVAHCQLTDHDDDEADIDE
jgi:hypothetical protein